LTGILSTGMNWIFISWVIHFSVHTQTQKSRTGNSDVKSHFCKWWTK
jgi:hypothetical protein